MCFYSLGSFFFKGKRDYLIITINQVNIFRVIINGKTFLLKKKMIKNSDNPSINICKVEAIFLVFKI